MASCFLYWKGTLEGIASRFLHCKCTLEGALSLFLAYCDTVEDPIGHFNGVFFSLSPSWLYYVSHCGQFWRKIADWLLVFSLNANNQSRINPKASVWVGNLGLRQLFFSRIAHCDLDEKVLQSVCFCKILTASTLIRFSWWIKSISQWYDSI